MYLHNITQHHKKQGIILLFCCLLWITPNTHAQSIITGAENMEQYLSLLHKKKVALLINQTSIAGNRLLLDTLLTRDISVTKIFAPEHGFRGVADAGAHIRNDHDSATSLPVISLYGKNKKPQKEHLADVDIVIYDLQDVGIRFYTYISTLQYAMEACAAERKTLIVLDRPNPNGFYIDGPVLDTSLRSFVGMQPVPIVYGMTAGEYALMLKGENWFEGAAQLDLKIIPCTGYDHTSRYEMPVAPSPNLKSPAAVLWYPSLCLFEGTTVSVGRGTPAPFEQWGHPDFKGKSSYSFVPQSMTGASKPLHEGKICYGKRMPEENTGTYIFTLQPLIEAFQWTPDKDKLFNRNNFFEKLAGNTQLRSQIMEGLSEEQIRVTWESDLKAFRLIRKKYLLYPDFE